jgi:hypothetical protein
MDHLQHSIKHIVDNVDKVVIFFLEEAQVVNVTMPKDSNLSLKVISF